MVNRYKSNHFVTESYLRQWCEFSPLKDHLFFSEYKNGCFSKFQQERLSSNKIHIKEDKLYWLSVKDNDHRVSLEKEPVFSKAESELGKILKKLKNKEGDLNSCLSEKDKQNIKNFIILLYLRRPDLVKPLKEKDKIEEGDLVYSYNLLLGGVFKLERQLLSSAKRGLELPERGNIPLETLKNITTAAEYEERFGHMEVVIINARTSNYRLLTSNQPIIYSTILIKESYDFAFPLSPDKIILIASRKTLASQEFKKMAGFGVDDWVINSNRGILANFHNGIKGNYQIYSCTGKKEKILPANLWN